MNHITRLRFFNALFQERREDAYGRARLFVPWAADDVVQEAFLWMWKKGKTLEWPELRVKVTHVALNHARGEKRLKAHVKRAAESYEEASMQSEPRELAQEAEAAASMRRALAVLPLYERMALVLHESDGLGHAEIGKHLRVSEDAAFRLVKEGRRKLTVAMARGGVVGSVPHMAVMPPGLIRATLPAELEAKILAIPSSIVASGSLALRVACAAAGVLGAVVLMLTLNEGTPSPPRPASGNSVASTAIRHEDPVVLAAAHVDRHALETRAPSASPVEKPEKVFNLPLVAPPPTEDGATETLALLRVVRSLHGKGAELRRAYLLTSSHPRHAAELQFGAQACSSAMREHLHTSVCNLVALDVVRRTDSSSPLLCLLASVMSSAPDDCLEEVEESTGIRLLARHIAATAPVGSSDRLSAIAILGGIGTSEDAVVLAGNRTDLGDPVSGRTLTALSVSCILARTAVLGTSTLSVVAFDELKEAVAFSGSCEPHPGSLLSPRWGAGYPQAEQEVATRRASVTNGALASVDFRLPSPVCSGFVVHVFQREAELEFEADHFRCLACPGESQLRLTFKSEQSVPSAKVRILCVAANRPWLPKSDVLVRVSLDEGTWRQDLYIDFPGSHWVETAALPPCTAGPHSLTVTLLRGSTTFRVEAISLVVAK